MLSPGAPKRFRLFRINMWALAVSHVLPGGTVPGTAVSYRLLTEAEVPGNTAAFGLATQGIGSAVVLNVLFWLALLISIPLNGYNPYYGFAAILGVLLLSIFGGLVALLTRGEKQADRFLLRVASHIPFVKPESVAALVKKVADRTKVLAENPQLLYRASIWAAANWLLDASSLWVFLFAFGAHVSPIDLLVAYGLANILAVIPITPGGLGVVEFISHLHAHRVRRPRWGRHRRGPLLAPRQLLAPHPFRRGLLRHLVAESSAPRRQHAPELQLQLERRQPQRHQLEHRHRRHHWQHGQLGQHGQSWQHRRRDARHRCPAARLGQLRFSGGLPRPAARRVHRLRVVLRIGHRVVAPEFDEALVEGMGDDVVVLSGRPEGPVEEGLELQARAHAPKFEVAQP